MDPTTQRVWRSNTEIDLSPKAFVVLQTLMRRGGDIITKQELLDTARGFEHDGDPNIVEAYISRIRARIDKPFGTNSIRTIRGVGYRLAPTDVA